jgi:hypothetical protein
MIKTRFLIAACSVLLAFTACKKKDDAAKTDQGSGSAATATKPTESKPAETKPAGGGDITSAADYETRGNALMDKMIGIFAADGKDCDKLAADINKFLDDSKGDMDAVMAYEKAHPDDKKAMDKKNEAKTKEFMEKAGPAIEGCKDNKALQDAMAKMPG